MRRKDISTEKAFILRGSPRSAQTSLATPSSTKEVLRASTLDPETGSDPETIPGLFHSRGLQLQHEHHAVHRLFHPWNSDTIGVVLLAFFLASPRSEPPAPQNGRALTGPEGSPRRNPSATVAEVIAATLGESGVRTEAFAKWPWTPATAYRLRKAELQVAGCASSFSGCLYQGLAGQLRLMIEPEFCLTGTNATLNASCRSYMPDPTQILPCALWGIARAISRSMAWL
ncbi:unnamed protein product [Symbiodinium sp. CCMP2592]|nr:unnamed protein product [Symbiodinium sp. CCMP2592]